MIIENPARTYATISVSDQSTVVSEWIPEKPTATTYQSEDALEQELIKTLQSQAYEYLPIKTEDDLLANLRTQLEALNKVTFSDSEWETFFNQCIATKNDTIADKTQRIQDDFIQLLHRDDGTIKNIKLIDKTNIHNNRLQVINQYETPGKAEGGKAKYSNRYDVTILVNGLPMVHIELKRRGVAIREAFNQINRYERDSFWAGSGLFDYVQIFVISNGTQTKYYSNTTRNLHIKETQKQRNLQRRSSHSFEFTSWWADATNKPILDLTDFAQTFFAQHSLLNILTRYCVFTVDQMLLVMRPYQIVATEAILQQIKISAYNKMLGTIDAGGYVWHTTGSGKTLTSFKAAQLASHMESVDKVLFVVDRKDLDYQTMREYDKFEKGAANSNTSTAVLQRQLQDPSARIIITTIQKLATFIKKNPQHEVYSQHVVLMFDECHRSQFGEMHTAIAKAFKRYNIFGFTGTPIFAVNAASGGNVQLKTTEQAFGKKLHTYTIVDAIRDDNVLRFHIDYIDTVQTGDVDNRIVEGIDTDSALLASQRIQLVAKYILEHFDQKTKRSASFFHDVTTNVEEASTSRKRKAALVERRRINGFNALFATQSIVAARMYYEALKELQKDLVPEDRKKIAIIYSYGPNEDEVDGILADEAFDTGELPKDHRDFLESAIADYNNMFGTSYDTSSEKFQNYYKDLSYRLKNREVDLAIVVNMFLTGFDATTLNTLFVDKTLRAHGLIQAYSRTNRIYNSVKTYGNIVTFRNLEKETNQALELFGNKDARGIVLLKPYAEYYKAYQEIVNELLVAYPLGEQIVGEEAEKAFIMLFGRLLRLENILTSFDDFEDQQLLTERDSQDYRSIYLDLYHKHRDRDKGEKENIDEDVVFEIELVKQVEINIDYILLLVEKHREEHGDGDDALLKDDISRAIDASPTLRNKKDLVIAFVDSISHDENFDQQWVEFIENRRKAELNDIIDTENLDINGTKKFMATAFRDGLVRTTGTAIAKILPPVSRFSPDGGHGEKKNRVIKKLNQFFDRYYVLTSGIQDE